MLFWINVFEPCAEFVAGEVVHALMSLTNNWQQEFVVTGIEASFRYPQDFSYYIQNVSACVCVSVSVCVCVCVCCFVPCDYNRVLMTGSPWRCL